MATKPLIAIVGQTASGKTALAIELAKKYGGEIVCADSRTVYKNMDICTAKPTKTEQDGTQHHLLDIVEVTETFNVAKFKDLANQSIKDILNRSKIPILVGGSGLFIDAVLYDYSFSEPNSKRDYTNPRHLNKSVETSKQPLRQDTLIIGLKLSKDKLDKRINKRADDMEKHGLLDEVRALSTKFGWNLPAFQEPAFKAFRPYIEQEQTLEEAKKVFITLHRQYSKRQMTWFKRNPDIKWASTNKQACNIVSEFVNK